MRCVWEFACAEAEASAVWIADVVRLPANRPSTLHHCFNTLFSSLPGPTGMHFTNITCKSFYKSEAWHDNRHLSECSGFQNCPEHICCQILKGLGAVCIIYLLWCCQTQIICNLLQIHTVFAYDTKSPCAHSLFYVVQCRHHETGDPCGVCFGSDEWMKLLLKTLSEICRCILILYNWCESKGKLHWQTVMLLPVCSGSRCSSLNIQACS